MSHPLSYLLDTPLSKTSPTHTVSVVCIYATNAAGPWALVGRGGGGCLMGRGCVVGSGGAVAAAAAAAALSQRRANAAANAGGRRRPRQCRPPERPMLELCTDRALSASVWPRGRVDAGSVRGAFDGWCSLSEELVTVGAVLVRLEQVGGARHRGEFVWCRGAWWARHAVRQRRCQVWRQGRRLDGGCHPHFIVYALCSDKT